MEQWRAGSPRLHAGNGAASGCDSRDSQATLDARLNCPRTNLRRSSHATRPPPPLSRAAVSKTASRPSRAHGCAWKTGGGGGRRPSLAGRGRRRGGGRPRRRRWRLRPDVVRPHCGERRWRRRRPTRRPPSPSQSRGRHRRTWRRPARARHAGRSRRRRRRGSHIRGGRRVGRRRPRGGDGGGGSGDGGHEGGDGGRADGHRVWRHGGRWCSDADWGSVSSRRCQRLLDTRSPRPRVRGDGGAPLLPRPCAHTGRLGAGGGSGCARREPPHDRPAGLPTRARRRFHAERGRADAVAPAAIGGANTVFPPRAPMRSVYGRRPPAGAPTTGSGGQGRACLNPGHAPRRRAGWPRPAAPPPWAARWRPTTGGGALPAGRRRGGRPRPPTLQRLGGDAAVAAATALMGTPADAAAPGARPLRRPKSPGSVHPCVLR